MNSYQEMLKNPLLVQELDVTVKESYAFKDFLGLVRQLSELELMLATTFHQLRIEKANLQSDQSYVDGRLAAYLGSSKSDPERLQRGLKIMVRRVSIAIDKRKIAELETEKEQRSRTIKAMQEELAIARERIDPTTIDLSRLQKELQTIQNRLSQYQENLIHVQAEVSNRLNFFSNEEILNQTLKRALVEAELSEAKLKLMLGQVILHPEKRSVKELYLQLALLEDERVLLNKELRDWKSAADLYYELSLTHGSQKVVELTQNIGMTIQKVEQQHRLNSFLFQQCSDMIHLHYSTFSDRLAEFWESFAFRWKQYSAWAHKSMFKIGQTPITFFGLIKTVILIFIAYFVAKFVRFWINTMGRKQSRIKQAAIYSLGRISYYVIYIIGILLAISSIGLDFTAFAVIAGALSVGIGFGLQSIVNNFVSGIILLIEKKLRVGDLIQLETGEFGRVIEVNVRTTLVRTFDNLEILVPNADFVSKKFTNWTLTDRIRRVRIPFSVAYGTDKALVKKAALAAAQNIEITIKDKQPQVWLSKFGDSGLDFELVVWVNESICKAPPMGTVAWYTWELDTALSEHGIEIPYPIQEIRIKKEP